MLYEISKIRMRPNPLSLKRFRAIGASCDRLHSITLISPIDTKIHQKGVCNNLMTTPKKAPKSGRPTNRPPLEVLEKDIQRPSTTVYSLARKYNVSESTVLRWLRQYNLSAKYLTYEKRYRRGDPRTPIKLEEKRDRLTYLYKTKCMSQAQIAKQFHVHPRTVSRWLKQLNIVLPNTNTKPSALMVAKSHEAQLRRLYIDYGFTIQKTADLLRVHRTTVSKWLDLLNITKTKH